MQSQKIASPAGHNDGGHSLTQTLYYHMSQWIHRTCSRAILERLFPNTNFSFGVKVLQRNIVVEDYYIQYSFIFNTFQGPEI